MSFLPRLYAWLLPACLFLALAGVGANAAASEVLERSVKAASIYKFLSYVEWPAGALPAAEEPLVIGVAGANETFEELQRITAGRQAQGHALIVRKLRPGEAVDDLHVLFVGHNADDAAQLRQAQKHPVLTITESEQGFAAGSMINFRIVNERVRFEVSLPAAERVNIKISSRMLPIAIHVVTGAAP